jgi:hypothetical protein
MRLSCLALSAVIAVPACHSSNAVKTFEPIADLETTQPRSLAEGGHAAAIIPPAGVRWRTLIEGFGDVDNIDGAVVLARYEMTVKLVELDTDVPVWTPMLDHAELVDDLGNRYRCTRAILPSPPTDDTQPSDPRVYTLIFELPATYRFRPIWTITVHWGIQDGRGTIQWISSRYRS